MKDLTSSVYSFEDLIRGNFLYVDKTEYIWRLIRPAKEMYFLSRPRRFGKSLTVSTLKAVFEGKKELFKGLAIYDKPYDWKPYPVLHLDMANCDIHSENDLRDYLVRILRAAEFPRRRLHVLLQQPQGQRGKANCRLSEPHEVKSRLTGGESPMRGIKNLFDRDDASARRGSKGRAVPDFHPEEEHPWELIPGGQFAKPAAPRMRDSAAE